jgi:hypothetical protein
MGYFLGMKHRVLLKGVRLSPHPYCAISHGCPKYAGPVLGGAVVWRSVVSLKHLYGNRTHRFNAQPLDTIPSQFHPITIFRNSLPYTYFKIYAISSSVFVVADFKEVSLPKFCQYFLYPLF